VCSRVELYRWRKLHGVKWRRNCEPRRRCRCEAANPPTGSCRFGDAKYFGDSLHVQPLCTWTWACITSNPKPSRCLAAAQYHANYRASDLLVPVCEKGPCIEWNPLFARILRRTPWELRRTTNASQMVQLQHMGNLRTQRHGRIRESLCGS
jgi:hypothetical protein